jgi:hypothetical protein
MASFMLQPPSSSGKEPQIKLEIKSSSVNERPSCHDSLRTVLLLIIINIISGATALQMSLGLF